MSELRLPDGSDETLRSNVVISAVGAFGTPKWPDIPGFDEFRGPVLHTAQWDESAELEGKRVAVIGNGASAMQLVPAIADQVGSLHEHGVDLAIDGAEAAELPEAHGGAAPAWRVHEPGVKPSRWKSLVDMVSGARPHRRDWDEEN